MSASKHKTNKLKWYLDRLGSMNIHEITFRVGGLLRNQYERQFKVGYTSDARLQSYPEPILFQAALKDSFNTATHAIFGRALDLTQPIDWHQDIISNSRFPLAFSRSIDTRTEQHGIVKVVWEVNRLQFLTNICLEYQRTKDAELLDRFVAIIRSWQKENPYLTGVNWYSNIEISLRIITWFLCWEILDINQLCKDDKNFEQFVQEQWIPLIHLHGIYSHSHPSKFSSSNNHLIAEAAGLFIAGAYWDLPDTKSWTEEALEILEREILLQHSENGVNKEEASEYIQFITDFFLIAYVVGTRKGYTFSKEYEARLQQIFYYIADLMDLSGRVPYYGDDDDGHAFILKNKAACNNFQSLLISGAILFNDATLKTKAAAFDLKNEILFGEQGRIAFDKLKNIPPAVESKIYKEEGHIILKNGNEHEEIYLHIDTAPLGYLSIAAHGHADALSFFLHVDGIPFLADMGTYTYHSEPELRAYFKGTLAHNTIRVDGQDQADNGGPCLWRNHYESQLLDLSNTDTEAFVKATHTGYTRIGVSHTRSFYFDKIKNTIRIVDEIASKDDQEHQYELPFHLHPDINVSKQQDKPFALTHPHAKRKIELKLDPICEAKLYNGSTEPLLAWYSPSFLQKEKTTTIYTTWKRKGNFKLETILSILETDI